MGAHAPSGDDPRGPGLFKRIEERHGLRPDETANNVEVWASGQRFGGWRA
jgi:hypothetical protein